MMTILLALGLILGGVPVDLPDDVAVPGHFYTRTTSIEELPSTYGTTAWMEGRFGSWLEASRAKGPLVIAALEAHLGPPLMLPAWGPVPPREAYVWARRASSEAGLLILLDRKRGTATLKIYLTRKLPREIAHRPESYTWEYRLMAWFRSVTTPRAAAGPPGREAAPR